MHDKFKILDSEICKLKNIVNDYQKEIAMLQEINNKLQNDNTKLKDKLQLLNEKHEKLKQNALLYDVKVSGIHIHDDENLDVLSNETLSTFEMKPEKHVVRECLKVNGQRNTGPSRPNKQPRRPLRA